MTGVDPTLAVVKFVEAVDAAGRHDLMVMLERSLLGAKIGLDLGDRGTANNLKPLVVVTILGEEPPASGTITRISIDVRDWLRSRSLDGSSSIVEIELRSTGSAAVVQVGDTDAALNELEAVLPTMSGASPVAWRNGGWNEASSNDASLRQGLPIGRSARRIRVLAIETDWFSVHGGMSTFNRLLCTALAQADADVCCAVLDATAAEIEDAATLGVTLVLSRPVPGGSARDALLRRPALPADFEPDLVIGHGRITGQYARSLVEDHFPAAARVHIIHTASDEIEWQRPDLTRAGEAAEQNTALDVELAKDATLALGVGPRLYNFISRELSTFDQAHKAQRIDPGFDLGPQSKRTPPPGHPKQIMLIGRLEDWKIKGLDFAAKAVARAMDLMSEGGIELELLLRGVPSGQHAELRELVRGWTGKPTLRVVPRTYSSDVEQIRRDLRRATLVLMPSRAEGFGLTGLEAITAGTPTLVSATSGLGMLLREALPPEDAGLVVLPVDNEENDISRWAAATAAVLRDPTAAFANAARIGQLMSEKTTWAKAATLVLDAQASRFR